MDTASKSSASDVTSPNESWISVLGNRSAQFQRQLEARVAQHVAAKDFSADNVAYISKVHFQPIYGNLTVNAKRLEKIRLLCQLWDVKLRPAEITSHRKFIGPIIVGAKKVLYPIVRVFLKDSLHQQRSFNAASIALLAELSEEVERLRGNPTPPSPNA